MLLKTNEQMNQELEILPLEGFGNIKFGQHIDEVISIIGEPEETDEINNDEEFEALACNYWEKGYTLFFEGAENNIFTYIEVDNRNSILYGKEIFAMKEGEIIDLMKSKGFKVIDLEEENWGEKRITFDECLIDFYFDNGTLNSVSWGVFIDSKGKIDTLQNN